MQKTASIHLRTELPRFGQPTPGASWVKKTSLACLSKRCPWCRAWHSSGRPGLPTSSRNSFSVIRAASPQPPPSPLQTLQSYLFGMTAVAFSLFILPVGHLSLQSKWMAFRPMLATSPIATRLDCSHGCSTLVNNVAVSMFTIVRLAGNESPL